MKRLIEAARQFLTVRARAVALVGLVGLMGWLLVASQPAYAATSQNVTPQERNNSIAEKRIEAYEDTLEVINDPRGEQKEYQENLKEYREENPSQGGIVEEAKELVEKIVPGK